MASVLLPSTKVEGKGALSFGDSLEQLFSHYGHKFSTVRRIPQANNISKQFNTYTWKLLLAHLQQMQLADSAMEVSAIIIFFLICFVR
jgi:hypothetical protein